MIVDCLSDLHGFYPKLEGGDLLIIAGDLTARDSCDEHEHFKEWVLNQNYTRKILIAGNHDGHIEKCELPRYDDGIDYLQDSGTEFEGLKIWGSPWTPPFCNWHFMLPPNKIKKKWDLIPDDVDILVTHGPPYGILDHVEISSRGDEFKHAGCKHLRDTLDRIKPKLHVFGHIHECGGQQMILKRPGIGDENNTICVNASIMDEHYKPVNKPIRIEF